MPQHRRSRHSLLVLFVFVTVVFGFLAYRSEEQARDIETDAYLTCLDSRVNVARLNHFYTGMIAVERSNPFVSTSPGTILRRIDLYEAVILTPPKCGKDPR